MRLLRSGFSATALKAAAIAAALTLSATAGQAQSGPFAGFRRRMVRNRHGVAVGRVQ